MNLSEGEAILCLLILERVIPYVPNETLKEQIIGLLQKLYLFIGDEDKPRPS